MRITLASLSVSLLLFGGCSRHQEQRARHEQAGTAAPAITKIASGAEAVAGSAVSRPSPFEVVATADREQPAPAPAAPTPAPSQAASDVRKPLKSLELSSIQPQNRVVPLPAPPPLPASSSAATALPLADRFCCLGAATAEPAKPARVVRVLSKIPGLRRLRQSPDVEAGYVAARPARPITMVLPPESRAALGNGMMELKATVDESGGVVRVEILSPKDEDLVQLASYAASNWHFVPARLNDKTVASEVILHFSF